LLKEFIESNSTDRKHCVMLFIDWLLQDSVAVTQSWIESYKLRKSIKKAKHTKTTKNKAIR
jgi:hypothetical protein